MRAVLTSFGSTGDIEPFLGLASELRRHGHQPIFAVTPAFEARIRQFGFLFVPTGPGDLNEALRSLLEAEIKHGITSARQILSVFPSDGMACLLDDLLDACTHADVLISSAEHPFGKLVHELTGIPYVSIHLDYFGRLFEKDNRVGLFEQQMASLLNPFRAGLGLPPVRRPFGADGNSQQLALFAMTRLILDEGEQAEWPEHHHITGFFFFEDGEQGWQPDPELVAFLEGGEPPIVVTFGSMVHDDPDALTELLLSAIQQVGRRAILQHGWSGLARERLMSPEVYVAGFVPYSWLFPRVACVVQSAGHGTTAWALHAGVPNVCVPHMWQQYAYASFAQAIGCAGPIVPYRELSAERLSAAITETLTNPRYLETARALGEQVRAEQGVQTAQRIIERWYAETMYARSSELSASTSWSKPSHD